MEEWDGHRVIGHGGGTIGQLSFLQAVPDEDLVVALLTNSMTGGLLWRADDTHYHSGLNHFGITLESDEKEAVYERLEKMGHSAIKPPLDRSYVEDYCKDIDGNKFDLSTSGVKADKNQKMVFSSRKPDERRSKRDGRSGVRASPCGPGVQT